MFLLLLVILGAAIGARIWRNELPVGGVRIEGTRVVPEADIFHLAAVPMDSALFDVDLAAIRKRIRQSPYVKHVAVQRDPPDRVLIQVEERVPVALVVADGMFYCDADGVLMPAIRSENAFDLPILTGVAGLQPCVAGKRLTHPVIREALHLVMVAERLDDALYRRISEVHITSTGDLVLYTADAGIPVTVGHGDITTKLEKFTAFWSSVVTSRGVQSLASVDLRFADQVVVRWTRNGEEPAN